MQVCLEIEENLNNIYNYNIKSEDNNAMNKTQHINNFKPKISKEEKEILKKINNYKIRIKSAQNELDIQLKINKADELENILQERKLYLEKIQKENSVLNRMKTLQKKDQKDVKDILNKKEELYSVNEKIIKMKDEAKIKKDKNLEDPFQPPRAKPKNSQNIINELRKNLTEKPQNSQQNKQIQEELNKIKMMQNNNYSSNNLNYLYSNSINNTPSVTHMINNLTNNNESEITEFENGFNNNSHNSHNELNLEEDQLNTSLEVSKEKEKEKTEKDFQIKFDKFPTPKNKSEIKIFFMNLICYINSLLSTCSLKNNNKLYDELTIFKYKLETRYNDYRNHGLNEQYFINKLKESQEELINKIGIGIVSKKDKKEDSLNSLNLNNIINIRSNYTFIGKKRKKSLSEMRSITDGSSSYEEGEGDSH